MFKKYLQKIFEKIEGHSNLIIILNKFLINELKEVLLKQKELYEKKKIRVLEEEIK